MPRLKRFLLTFTSYTFVYILTGWVLFGYFEWTWEFMLGKIFAGVLFALIFPYFNKATKKQSND